MLAEGCKTRLGYLRMDLVVPIDSLIHSSKKHLYNVHSVMVFIPRSGGRETSLKKVCYPEAMRERSK